MVTESLVNLPLNAPEDLARVPTESSTPVCTIQQRDQTTRRNMYVFIAVGCTIVNFIIAQCAFWIPALYLVAFSSPSMSMDGQFGFFSVCVEVSIQGVSISECLTRDQNSSFAQTIQALSSVAVALHLLAVCLSLASVFVPRITMSTVGANFLSGVFYLATAAYLAANESIFSNACNLSKATYGLSGSCNWGFSFIYFWIAWLLCWISMLPSGMHHIVMPDSSQSTTFKTDAAVSGTAC